MRAAYLHVIIHDVHGSCLYSRVLAAHHACARRGAAVFKSHRVVTCWPWHNLLLSTGSSGSAHQLHNAVRLQVAPCGGAQAYYIVSACVCTTGRCHDTASTVHACAVCWAISASSPGAYCGDQGQHLHAVRSHVGLTLTVRRKFSGLRERLYLK